MRSLPVIFALSAVSSLSIFTSILCSVIFCCILLTLYLLLLFLILFLHPAFCPLLLLPNIIFSRVLYFILENRSHGFSKHFFLQKFTKSSNISSNHKLNKKFIIEMFTCVSIKTSYLANHSLSVITSTRFIESLKL